MAKQRLDVGPGLGLPVLHVPVRGRREELLFSIIILLVVNIISAHQSRCGCFLFYFYPYGRGVKVEVKVDGYLFCCKARTNNDHSQRIVDNYRNVVYYSRGERSDKSKPFRRCVSIATRRIKTTRWTYSSYLFFFVFLLFINE